MRPNMSEATAGVVYGVEKVEGEVCLRADFCEIVPCLGGSTAWGAFHRYVCFFAE